MKAIALILTASLLQSCAYYTLDLTLADGTHVTGKAVILNNSEDVQLTVDSEAFTASFGKVGTSGSDQAGIVSDVVTGAIGAAVGL